MEMLESLEARQIHDHRKRAKWTRRVGGGWGERIWLGEKCRVSMPLTRKCCLWQEKGKGRKASSTPSNYKELGLWSGLVGGR